MADLVVGLAKSVVEGALTKAQAAIEEEAKLRQSAQRNLVFITDEFQMMHSFLKVANTERVENPVVMTWVRQIRELAYDVEDCIEFVVHLDKKNRWWCRIIPSCWLAPIPLDQAVSDIEQLKARVEDVSTRNNRYSLISDTGSKPLVMQHQELLPSAALAATKFNMLAEARGATKRQQGIFGDLTHLITKDKALQVISVSSGGSDDGTTSIIAATFKHPEICQSFTCRSWVKLVHPFSPQEFIRSMMDQFYANSASIQQPATIGMDAQVNKGHMHRLMQRLGLFFPHFEKNKGMDAQATQAVLVTEFQRLVSAERYLAVLEGLTNMADWDAIRALLPDTKKGSWIIVPRQQPEMAIGYSIDPDLGDLTRLITKKDNDLQVISVWGADGDHGTTPIIRKTYNHPHICKNFTYRAWVKLMHPFSPHDFMRSMMAQFYANSAPEQETETIGMHVLTKMEANKDNLFKDFQKLVTEEMYLVVLEGLTDMVDWDTIRTFLPDKKKGSWIIVSTQQPEIATLCVSESYQILELKRFSDDHSICALFKQASEDAGSKGKKPVVIKSSQGDGDEGNRKNNTDPLVGRNSRMKELGKYPARARTNSPPVMSVWGIAGVGKTALVRNLFDIMSRTDQFEKYYWVDVSHPFSIRDLYMILLPDIHSEKDPIEECHHLLKNNRCLIVIDDLWSTQEWDLMQPALVCKHPKSVIIVITTEASVAKQCTNNNEDLVFNVKALETAAAFDLFKNQVLPDDPSNIQDNEVQELILKCGGIPKVIATIAGLLATKDKSMDAVRSLNRRFMAQLETDPEYDSLQDLFGWLHSYFRTCPDSLKPCIFYLSIFPRDQIIRRRRLIRRWIAEGYSRDSHNESAEENGEKQFSQLLELSIIQQLSSQSSSSNASTVRMVLCQVNGFIREYIVSRQMEENLVFELGDKCALATQRTGRHLVILENWDRDRFVFESIDFSRLRSLTVFGNWESFFISEGMKMLRVLDLEEASALNDGDLDKMVEWLRRLKFLSLRGHTEIHQLPSSVKLMRQLQTLDVRGTSIVTLPKSIRKLHKLQYIRVGTTEVPTASSSCFPRRRPLVGVKLPSGTGKLTALHTFGVVNIGASGTKAMMKVLKKLTQLHKLGVSGINRKNSREFIESVQVAHLESLSMQLDKDNECCLDDISIPWMNLRSLKLYGLGDKLPTSIELLTKLTKLDLEMAKLMPTDIKLLAELPELFVLRLSINQPSLVFEVKISGLEASSYEKVRTLEIACSSSDLHVSFGSKTMKNLEFLMLDCSKTLYRLSSLNKISQLKEVTLKGTNDEMKTALQEELANHPKRPVVKLE